MSAPSARQQAGYLRRLLRRGEIEVVDPETGRAVPVMVELRAEVIRIVPMLESPKAEVGVTELPVEAEGAAFAAVLARLRRVLSLEQIEEIAAVVETESRRAGDIDPPV